MSIAFYAALAINLLCGWWVSRLCYTGSAAVTSKEVLHLAVVTSYGISAYFVGKLA